MTAEKISVSLPREEIAWLRRQAKAQKTSVSAVLSEAVRQARRERALDEVLRYLDVKVTPAEMEELLAEWRG